MLEFLFGWRKASKCRDMLRSLRRRLKPLRSKSDSIVRQQRQVIAHLLKSGSPIANTLPRVEQLNQDQSLLAAYDLLDQFCGFIIMSLCYIRKHKDILDCPREIIEAIATVMFTAARLANLPELQVLRKLFGGRYGRDFEASALELYPGFTKNCTDDRETFCSVYFKLREVQLDTRYLSGIPSSPGPCRNGDENLSPDCCLDHPCYFLASEHEVSDQASSNITKKEMIDVSSVQKSYESGQWKR